MLQNARFPAFNISEYLKENQQGKGVGWGAKKIRVKNLFEKLTKMVNLLFEIRHSNPTNYLYLFKVNNRNNRKSREICSKLTRKTPEQHQ